MSKYHQICSLYMQFPFIIDILNIHFDPQENQTRWCLHYWLLMIKSTQPPFVYRLSPHLALLFAIWTFRRMITIIMKWVLLHQPRPLNSNSLVLLRKGLHLKDCLVVSSNQVLRFLGDDTQVMTSPYRWTVLLSSSLRSATLDPVSVLKSWLGRTGWITFHSLVPVPSDQRWLARVVVWLCSFARGPRALQMCTKPIQ